jgi:hypothetical protein
MVRRFVGGSGTLCSALLAFPGKAEMPAKLSCQTEIWTGRVQDDRFRELGMEEKPVSIDPPVNKVEKAEN